MVERRRVLGEVLLACWGSGWVWVPRPVLWGKSGAMWGWGLTVGSGCWAL